MASFTGAIEAKITGTLSKSLDLTTPQDPLGSGLTKTISIASGTGANQANQCWHDSRTLAASASETLDLNASLTNAFGDSVTFTKIKALWIQNTSTASTLIVGAAASNQWAAALGATGTLTIRPGGGVLLWAPDADGYAVAAGSTDNLKLAHGGEDSDDLTYQIGILGVN